MINNSTLYPEQGKDVSYPVALYPVIGKELQTHPSLS